MGGRVNDGRWENYTIEWEEEKGEGWIEFLGRLKVVLDGWMGSEGCEEL